MKQALFFALLLLTLAGCAEAPRNSLRFAIETAPTNLDPRFATDATSTRINRLLYQRLVDFNDAAEPIPALATWQLLNPQQYRFTLPTTARFADSSPLTSQDVKATYDSILDPKTASPHRTSLEVIQVINIINDQTVDFVLNYPDPLFPGYLVIGILPARLLTQGHSFSDQPVGSGAFRFAGRTEGQLQLIRQADQQVFEFLYVADPTVRVLKLLKGEVDLLQNDLPPELVSYLERQPGIQVQHQVGTNFTYLGLNLNDPDTRQHTVRLAIAHALDRAAIIHYVLGNNASMANALLTPQHWAGNPNLKGYSYDPERARALLKQAGFDAAHPLKLTYKTSSNPFRIRLATIIQAQLKQVGIEVNLLSYDWGTFYSDIKAGRFQLFSLSWVGIKSPDVFKYAFHSQSFPPQGANRGRYSDPLLDQWLDTAAKTQDRHQQALLYQQIQQRLLEQLPYIPLWYEGHVFIARDSITGYDMGRDGHYDGLAQLVMTPHPTP